VEFATFAASIDASRQIGQQCRIEFATAESFGQLRGVDAAQRRAQSAFDHLVRQPGGVDRCGERGEFHTCVHAGPMFAHPLAVRTGERVLREERFAYTDLERVA
jgi:diphthamide synthase (EF-2-diphthine--ammonia ligase)